MFKRLLGKVQHPLRQRLQQEPYYRFQSFEEMQIAARWGIKIDANTASVDDWLRLPGISIHQARALTQLTEKGMVFNCIEDIAAALNLPLGQVQPWQAMLQFCYYDREIALEPAAIDANKATAEELATVPTIDTFLGRAIVHYRKDGDYENLADLQDRLRLTTTKATELLHYLKF